MLDELEGWFGEMERAFRDLPLQVSPEVFAARVAASLTARPLLTRLLAVLHSALEQNVDVATAAAFKRGVRDLTVPAGEALERRLAMLRPGDGVRFLMRLNALVMGLYPMATPSPVVAEALRAPDLSAMIVNFETELSESVAAMLRGWGGVE